MIVHVRLAVYNVVLVIVYVLRINSGLDMANIAFDVLTDGLIFVRISKHLFVHFSLSLSISQLPFAFTMDMKC